MSIATAPTDGLAGTAAPVQPASAPAEICPLCSAPLQPAQEWCLRCGAAARTRLAASPNWRAPLLGAVAVVVLSLGVLAAALVKLAGTTGPAPQATTKTVTSTQAALSVPSTPAPSTPTVGVTPPVTPTSSTPITPPASTTTKGVPGAAVPGTTTTTPGKAQPKSIAGLSPALTKRLLELSKQKAGKGK